MALTALLSSVASAASAAALACLTVVAADLGEEAAVEMIVGMDRGLRSRHQGYRRRAYRHAHRIPVLYSQNQSRTNRALLRQMERRGRVSLPSCSI